MEGSLRERHRGRSCSCSSGRRPPSGPGGAAPCSGCYPILRRQADRQLGQQCCPKRRCQISSRKTRPRHCRDCLRLAVVARLAPGAAITAIRTMRCAQRHCAASHRQPRGRSKFPDRPIHRLQHANATRAMPPAKGSVRPMRPSHCKNNKYAMTTPEPPPWAMLPAHGCAGGSARGRRKCVPQLVSTHRQAHALRSKRPRVSRQVGTGKAMCTA